jgi:DNA helicase-2/ATP-dependent DNA helicase PcrA
MGLGRAEPVMLGDVSGRVGKPGYGPGWGRMASRMITGQQNSSSGAPQRDRDGWLPDKGRHNFENGMRVFHQKFGMGSIELVDADKLEIAFDKAGLKKVVASFVSLPDETN